MSITLWQGSLCASPPFPAFSSTYGEVGLGPFPIPLPVFGVGYRTQAGHHGWDLSLKGATIVHATTIKGSLVRNYYFRPNLRSQFYAGGGIGLGVHFGCHPLPLVTPEFVFGKQYLTDTGGLRFLQMQASFPMIALDAKEKKSTVIYFPLVVLSYGVFF